jgi:hypothetical protein
MAATHKRLGMRLSAVGAVADILHRLATGLQRGDSGLSPDMKATILDWVKDQDPGANPSLLMMLAHLDEDRATDRLIRLLRDPRADVRAGAVVTLRRMALSSLTLDAARPLADVERGLVERRFAPDVGLELARLVGEAGWSSLRSVLAHLEPVGAAREVVAEALRRLDMRNDPDSWSGVYTSNGLDVLEQDEGPRHGSLMVVHGGYFAIDAGGPLPLRLSAGRLMGPEGSIRMVWAARVGFPERTPALQSRSRTWYRLEGKLLVEAVESGSLRTSLAAGPASGALYAALAAEDGPAAERARAIVLCQEGRWTEGRAALLALMDGKRSRWELYPWLARASEALGDGAGARAAWLTVLEKAPRRSPLRTEAESRIAELQLADFSGETPTAEGDT